MPLVSVGVVAEGVSDVSAATLLDDAEVDAAATVRAAAHRHSPSTTRHPIDSVGAGPREVPELETLGPNCACALATSSRTADSFLTKDMTVKDRFVDVGSSHSS
jgi:hypothetical protein